MKKYLLSAALLALFGSAANAACTPPLHILDGSGTAQSLTVGVGNDTNCLYNFGSSGAIGAPAATITLPASTTAYTPGQQVGAAGSSFTTPNAAGGFYETRVRISTNDAGTGAGTAWDSAGLIVDEWTASPTLGGDRTAFAVTTGAATHLATYTCFMSPTGGDGAYAECAPNVGTTPAIKLASGTSVFVTLRTNTGSTTVVTASKTFTITAEATN